MEGQAARPAGARPGARAHAAARAQARRGHRTDYFTERTQEDRAHGGALTRTLEAYAAADRNAKAAAEELLIHVNTAHHRLGRIEETTGRGLRRLSDVIELLNAIRLIP